MTTLNDLYDFAEEQDIEVYCIDTRKVESMSVMLDDECAIGINPLLLRSEREEMLKLAHELGHCVLGAFYNEYSPFDIRAKHERRADEWAIKKLVTKDEFIDAVKSGNTEPWQLAEVFDLPEQLIRKAAQIYLQ